MSIKSETPSPTEIYNWQPQPKADQMYRQLVDDCCLSCNFAAILRKEMLEQTGTRLIDWVDHLAISDDTELNGKPFEQQLIEFGYEFDAENLHGRWYIHPGGLFVPICITKGNRRIVVKVEAVDDFLAAHQIYDVAIQGARWSQMRRAQIDRNHECEFWICQRHGYPNWSVPEQDDTRGAKAAGHYEAFKLRRREFEDDLDGFEFAKTLVCAAVRDLGSDWACDLFFTTEREYWQRRNLAARVQKERQDRLGLGWANHDHHTYRSSRRCFRHMIEVFELLGFHCRESFYAGKEAGWGAQVLEQPGCGIVIFADVDLTPAELAGDFAHDGLGQNSELGTVGLWCQLHGEAFLQAGMHHLECTFDFDAARDQLAKHGVNSMAPFTDFDSLRQAFTTGEIWKPNSKRTANAVAQGWITQTQADKFTTEGTVGSHLEILERNNGFKGFNQTGVSDIIRKTDPRTLETGE